MLLLLPDLFWRLDTHRERETQHFPVRNWSPRDARHAKHTQHQGLEVQTAQPRVEREPQLYTLCSTSFCLICNFFPSFFCFSLVQDLMLLSSSIALFSLPGDQKRESTILKENSLWPSDHWHEASLDSSCVVSSTPRSHVIHTQDTHREKHARRAVLFSLVILTQLMREERKRDVSEEQRERERGLEYSFLSPHLMIWLLLMPEKRVREKYVSDLISGLSLSPLESCLCSVSWIKDNL